MCLVVGVAIAQSENPAAGYCDLISLHGQPLTTTADLKGKIPNQAYPLYLWEIRRGASVVYLAGSIHLLKPGV